MSADLDNGHVLMWYRWQHFWATSERRYFAMLVWHTSYMNEMKLKVGAECPN
ncbi:hypothetical protein [Iodobacter sp.]|uniref:hypothetical protein n=1 Tax=Iodobacter sp. TaxID=1915058 RepID=UPI0025DAD81C|nr:hypothetical protein [Iodobacter sp.]